MRGAGMPETNKTLNIFSNDKKNGTSGTNAQPGIGQEINRGNKYARAKQGIFFIF